MPMRANVLMVHHSLINNFAPSRRRKNAHL